MTIIWQYSGIENAAQALVEIQKYGTVQSWQEHIKTHVTREYGNGGVGYLETAGWCANIWADVEGKRHAKITLSSFGVLKMLGIKPI
jgi:hypothetical protein